MIEIPELLAPVGDWKNLDAALDAGADAVYFGTKGFNMRASAKNFGARDLSKLAKLCHARGVRAYLTVNTLIYESELAKLEKLLLAARKAGIDGIIAFDFAAIRIAARLGLEVHASTQVSAANSSALLALDAMGVSRFVLARECTLADIRRIRASLRKALGAKAAKKLKVEVFAHGAMCVSISGRCFMSEHQCGSSANRGACSQPCRREYRLVEKDGEHEWQLGEGYLMSPKDLCTLPFVEKLIEAGVDSLKIEGRMRSPEYVYTVVSAYRRALDFYGRNKGRSGWRAEFEALKKSLQVELETVYNRGFSSGFYHGKPVGEWTKGSGNMATKRKHLVGRVLNYYKKAAVAEVLASGAGFAQGDELLIEGPTSGFFHQKAESLKQDEKSLEKAEAGMSLTLPIARRVRTGDRLYVMR